MSYQTIQPFSVIGIAIRTTNENGQAGRDIPALWNRFITEGIAKKIPNKIDSIVYCVYTDYEKDHTRPYTTILGCAVKALDNIPTGMIGQTIEKGNYIKYTAKGNMLQRIVIDEWTKIWNTDLPSAFTADFERYDEKARNPEKAEIDIFIAVT